MTSRETFPDNPPPSNILVAVGAFNPSLATTELRFADGLILRLPTSALEQAGGTPAASMDPVMAGAGETTVVPIVEETMTVGRRVQPTGKVLLHKTVQEYETALNETLAVRTFDVERVVLNRPVDAAPPVRQEGDTTIYPLVEEQLILTKQLLLKEEVRVTRRDTERVDTRTVTLRREHLEVEREKV